MAPKKPTANQTTSSPPKNIRKPQQKRDTKPGGKNGKKDGVSGSSVFTWFMVIALLGVWTSVAVVWFDLVDYEDVLAKAKDFRYNLSEVLQGKLDAYDADGDGDFDVDDAKILLGLKERSVLPSEDSEDDPGRAEPADPGYLSDQDLEDALGDDESEHTHDYISDQDLADALKEDDYDIEAHEIDDQDLEKEHVHGSVKPLSETSEDFDLEDALDDKFDETNDDSDDFNLEDAFDATDQESLHSEFDSDSESLEGESESEDQLNSDFEESPERVFEEPVLESLMETLALEVPEEDLEAEVKETEDLTEPEEEPVLGTTSEIPDTVEAEDVLEEAEEFEQEAVEGTEIKEESKAVEETFEDDVETVAENPELEEHEAEETEDLPVDSTGDISESEEYDIEEEPTSEIVEDEHVHIDEGAEEAILSDVEAALYDYVPETEEDEAVLSDDEEQVEEEQQQMEEQMENKQREIHEEVVVDGRQDDHTQGENTLVADEEEEPSGAEKASEETKEKAKKKKPKLLNKFDKMIKAELNAAEKLRKKGKVEEALKAFEGLVTTYPQSPKARYGKAQSEDDLAEKRRSNEILLKAINTYEEVTGLPNAPADLVKLALQRRANRQQFLGRNRGSLVTLQKLVQMFSDDMSLKNELGVAYLLLGDNNKAKEVYEEVLSIDPNNGFAKVHYGFILKTDNKVAESVPYLKEGLESEEPGTDDGRFYFHLGDAYQRIGNKEAAYIWYEAGHKKGHFASLWQRSLYNVNGLKAQPWWTAKETGYAELVKTLEANWKTIRDEGLAVMDQSKGLFIPEDENLRETGDWSQYTLWQRGQKNEKSCKHSPRACSLLERFPDSTGCRRGQIKYSVMHPGTHVWPHTGPTNCRLRMHLGLVVPKEGCKIRCANDTRSWEEGKVLIFDDSFEHEVWQDADSYRLILIVDVWHPALTQYQRQTLPAI